MSKIDISKIKPSDMTETQLASRLKLLGDTDMNHCVRDWLHEAARRLTAHKPAAAPPVVKTYNGEPPEQFGLEHTSFILWFDDEASPPRYTDIKYSDLDPGDRWVKMPKCCGEGEA